MAGKSATFDQSAMLHGNREEGLSQRSILLLAMTPTTGDRRTLTVSGAVPVCCNIGEIVAHNRPDDVGRLGSVTVALEIFVNRV